MKIVSIARLMEKTRTLTVEFDGVSFEVEYRVHAITPELLSRQYIWQQLPLFVADWGLGDDQSGDKLAVTEDVCRRLPIDLQRAILTACFEDARGPQDEEKN